MEKNCVFCKIAKGELATRKVYDDGNVLGIVDIHPRFAKGQCVVFPRTHKPQFYQLSDEKVSSLMIGAKRVAKKIKNVFETKFVSMFTRGKQIPHVHIMLFPSGTEEVMDHFLTLLQSYQNLRENTTEEILDRIHNRLRES